MAEAFVNVTEGSGKKLHGYDRVVGANTVIDEIVLPGENYLASYVAGSGGGAISVATSSSHLLQVMAGASLKVRVRRIMAWQLGMATAAARSNFSLYRLTTAGTGGSVVGVAALDPADAAAGATAMQLPTGAGTEGTQVFAWTAGFMQTAPTSLEPTAMVFDIDFDRIHSKPLIIAAGTSNGIVIKMGTGVAGATVLMLVLIDESNF